MTYQKKPIVKWFVLFEIILLLSTFVTAQDDTDTESVFLGDVYPDHHARVVHHIPIFDQDGFRIFPGVNEHSPFSLKTTCGRCHDVGTISTGWHFHTNQDPNHGRAGEPWIYWDCRLGIQIPLSHRDWPGSFRPEQMGLSDWWFIQAFGRHMPGGGKGDPDNTDKADPGDYWDLSGSYTINCLSCHDAEALHDQAQVAEQIGQYNYQWAATASCAFAQVRGATRDFINPSRTSDTPVQVDYDKGRFYADNRVKLDLRKEVPNHRCSFCHATAFMGRSSFTMDKDVHMAGGMRCVDCHRHGLNHDMIRGYASEAQQHKDPDRFAFSCEGCHLGTKEHDVPDAGRLAAPYPVHKGMPLIHFEKLSCTACHSGPWPSDVSHTAKTSRAHGLGTQKTNRAADSLPHIILPVMAPGPDGKIAPHKLIWPAYWAWQDGNDIEPLALNILNQLSQDLFFHAKELEGSSWTPFTKQQVSQVLIVLAEHLSKPGQPVYISGGMVYSLHDGELDETEHQAAAPYMWPLAHDVRPTQQSLGVRACEDCHQTDAGFLFGNIAVDGPLVDPNATVSMARFHQLDPVLSKRFAQTFVFRPWMKVTCGLACLLILGVLVIFSLRALYSVARATDELVSK